MKRLMLALCFLWILIAPAFAEASGWTHAGNGYYTCDGCEYYYRRYRYCGQWRYRKTPYRVYRQYGQRASELKKQLIGIAKMREQYNTQARAAAQEHNEVLELAEALGLKGSFYPAYNPPMATGAGFGAQAYGAGYSAANYLPQAQQGSTVFGYSARMTYTDPVDEALVFRVAERLADKQIDATREAVSGYNSMASKKLELASAERELLAQGTAVERAITATAKALMAARPPNREVNISGESEAGIQVSKFETLIGQRCGSCHSPENASGGVDLTKLPDFSPEQLRKVMISIASDNMPRQQGAPSKPAPLPAAEKATILKHLALYLSEKGE